MPAWIRPVAPFPFALRDHPICDGALVVSLPIGFKTEDEEGTTTARHPGEDGAVIRFSVLNIDPEADVPSEKLGEEHVRRMAQRDHRTLVTTDRLSYFEYSEPVREGAVRAVMHYWIAGIDGRVVIGSCWARRSFLPSRSRSRVISAGRNAVQSLRWASSVEAGDQESGAIDMVDLTAKHSALLEERHTVASEAISLASAGADRLLGDRDDLDRIQRFLDRTESSVLQTELLEGLGIALGDLLARRLGLRWCTVEDHSRSMPALRYRDTHILVYALEMIREPIGRGERPNVHELFDATVKSVEQIRAKAADDMALAGS